MYCASSPPKFCNHPIVVLLSFLVIGWAALPNWSAAHAVFHTLECADGKKRFKLYEESDGVGNRCRRGRTLTALQFSLDVIHCPAARAAQLVDA